MSKVIAHSSRTLPGDPPPAKPAGIDELLTVTGIEAVWKPARWHQGMLLRGAWILAHPASTTGGFLREDSNAEQWRHDISDIVEDKRR